VLERGEEIAGVRVDGRARPARHDAPALHEQELGVGVPLLVGREAREDAAQGRLVGGVSHGAEDERGDGLDPVEVRHETGEPGAEGCVDRFGAGRVPVDVGDGPLPALALCEHGREVEIETHGDAP
jgi:hypothetical protein